MMVYVLSLLSMIILFAYRSENASAHKGMAQNPLTSHVLDTGRGKPASGIKSVLYKLNPESEEWIRICSRVTDKDGRLSHLISGEEFKAGIYKFHFATKPYYENLNMRTFYPYIEIVFNIENPSEHYHVPILLNAYGFTTYRGS